VLQQLIVDLVADLLRVMELPDPVVEFGSFQTPGVDRIEVLRALTYGEGSARSCAWTRSSTAPIP